jgi:hypothetical protein
MNALGVFFAVINAVLLLQVPRRWAHLPLLLGALYMSTGQTVSGMRLMILAGMLRVFIKRERISGGLVALDRMMFVWSAWAVCSSVFHSPFSGALVARLGLVYDGLGIYWLLRIFIQTPEDFLMLAKTLMVLLIPLAVAMWLERVMAYNWFSLLGAPAGIAEDRIRNGKVRAMGPFAHPILAGTVGAVCLPLVVLYWRRNRKLAAAGLAGAMGMIVASGSSGPILTAASALGALGLWKVRDHLKTVRRATLLLIIALAVVMNAPVYYLLSYIDLTGSSTGWHRAALIDVTRQHFSEWWMAGTDYTRHWMPTGIPANRNHTDITNVYIVMGVVGGMPLMLLFIGVLRLGFCAVGNALRQMDEASLEDQLLVWALGAILFSHAVTFVSVAYFDQTIVLYYLVLAAAGSIWAEVAFRQKSTAVGAGIPDGEGPAPAVPESRMETSPGVA